MDVIRQKIQSGQPICVIEETSNYALCTWLEMTPTHFTKNIRHSIKRNHHFKDTERCFGLFTNRITDDDKY